jgi:hypothetical protein
MLLLLCSLLYAYAVPILLPLCGLWGVPAIWICSLGKTDLVSGLGQLELNLKNS